MRNNDYIAVVNDIVYLDELVLDEILNQLHIPKTEIRLEYDDEAGHTYIYKK